MCRQPLSVEQLVPLPELKVRIIEWMAQQKEKATTPATAAAAASTAAATAAATVPAENKPDA